MLSTSSDKQIGVNYRIYRTHSNRRVMFLICLTLVLALILLLRLFFLQIIQGKEYRAKAEENSMRTVPIFAPRGIIYDRKSRILATNRLTHSLLFYPWKLSPESQEQTLEKLARYLGSSSPELAARMKQGFPGHPIYLKHQLDTNTLAQLLENQAELPGVQIVTSMGRFYPENHVASHTIGYMGEVTASEIEELSTRKYQPGMLLGKTGVEKNYEYLLKGSDGKKYYAIVPHENTQEIVRMDSPTTGYSLKLTLDKKLQAYCEQLLQARQHQGAIVVMDVNDGSILSLVSQPTYDLNTFSRGISSQEWQALVNSGKHPFLNRALRAYPPGSIFKVITAIAASEKGLLSPTRTFRSTGSYNVHGHIFYDWNRTGFGLVNIHQALAHSIDTVFYELSLEMGIETIKHYADFFNLNTPTGIELQDEMAGQVPDKFWKQQKFQQEWQPGDTVNTSIGQGYVQMTPLQAVQMIATVANRGKLLRPHLIDSVLDERGNIVKSTSVNVLAELNFSDQTWNMLHRGLADAVTYGTARALRLPDITVAGKTGTAEAHPKETHAWIIAYAPVERPRYAIAVFLEHGGSGGSDAAPLGRKVLNYLFHPQPEETLTPPKQEVHGNPPEN